MTRLPALLALSAVAACAATVQGVIFDEETNYPLARTHVTLVPLPGTSAATSQVLANDRGQYLFSGVPAGWYLIRASRVGYEVAEYGQSRPGLSGAPIEVIDEPRRDDGAGLRQIVMRRQAAITGTVVDDNSIGIAGWTVNVYTARPPVRRIGQTMTDDRGNFRFGELEPGTYLVRSGGGGLEDASTIVPSYYKYGTTVAGAEPVRIRLGETVAFVVVHTVEGRLYELNGDVTAPDKRSVKLTLITDTGRRIVANNAGPFIATGVPPGQVELLAEGPSCAGYQTVLVDRSMFARVDCLPVTASVVTGLADVPLIARRLDLDGPGPENAVRPGQILSPGHWEFTVKPDPARYLVSIQNEGDAAATPLVNDGWFELSIGNAPRLEVTISAKPASISGVVSSLSRPVIGAPVILALGNPDAPELSLQTWTSRADPLGNFSFGGLAPGHYRLVSSFDIDYDDPLARAQAVDLNVREGDAVTQSLEMIRQ